MPFETYECRQCGESFGAFEDANAARTNYCSPHCHTENVDH